MKGKWLFSCLLAGSLVFNLGFDLHSTAAAPDQQEAPPSEMEQQDVEECEEQGDSLPDGVSEEWWAQAHEYIELSEYEITWQDSALPHDLPGAYQAPNRVHGFRTYFTSQAILIVPRIEVDQT